MEDAGSQRCVCFTCEQNVCKMLRVASAARSNDGNLHGLTHERGHLAIEACARAVSVHGGEQDFACSARLGLPRPFDDFAACGLASAADEYFCIFHWIVAFLCATGVYGYNDSLRAKPAADFFNQFRTRNGRRVDAYLVRARIKDRCCIVCRADAAADSKGHEDLLRRSLYCINESTAALVGCGNVEQDDFICASFGVTAGEFGRVACVYDVYELHAFDDAARVYVKTCNDAPGQQIYSLTKFWRMRSPASPDFSGWNWTPITLAFSTAAVNGPP